MPIDTVNLWGFSEEPPKTKRGNSILTLGSINVNGEIRQKDDFYATDPNALKSLLEYETFKHEVWEPACGSGWLSNVLEEYADEKEIANFAKESVKIMQQKGLMTGKTENKFDPKGMTTRAEVATLLMRFMKK